MFPQLPTEFMDISGQINQLVYKVYGLNKTEISLVEREAAR